jgi:hypothetical protein
MSGQQLIKIKTLTSIDVSLQIKRKSKCKRIGPKEQDDKKNLF